VFSGAKSTAEVKAVEPDLGTEMNRWCHGGGGRERKERTRSGDETSLGIIPLALREWTKRKRLSTYSDPPALNYSKELSLSFLRGSYLRDTV